MRVPGMPHALFPFTLTVTLRGGHYCSLNFTSENTEAPKLEAAGARPHEGTGLESEGPLPGSEPRALAFPAALPEW